MIRRLLLLMVAAALMVSWLTFAGQQLPVAAVPVPTSSAPKSAGDLSALDAAYDIGTPTLRTIWVNPRKGRDSHTGATRVQALRTLTAAWARIPQRQNLTGTGYRIMITPGKLRPGAIPNYFESNWGTSAFPIVIEAANGLGTVTLPALNVFDVRYLYLLNLKISSRLGDGLHCEQCDHLLVRNTVIRGAPRDSGEVGDLVKVNQSQNIFIEGSDISGASDNAIDFVAVQYAAIRGSKIHDSSDWCAYAKGGSAYIRVEGNEIYDCGVGGFTAGQGTGFQFMTSPWLQYEAYDIKVTNNVIHDVFGAGLGVNGGYNILLAHNTMYRLGSRSHLMEFVSGHRSCDGQPGDDGRERCGQLLDAGGWGTTRVDDGDNFVRIPNRHVYVYNNLIINPTGADIGDQHFTVAGPYSGRAQSESNVATPTRFDDDLRFAGNVIWNGSVDLSLGFGDGSGCADANPTCNAALFHSNNTVNRLHPHLVAPAEGDYRLAFPGRFAGLAAVIPSFGWSDAPGGTPAGTASNSVIKDRDGDVRRVGDPPGAYVS